MKRGITILLCSALYSLQAQMTLEFDNVKRLGDEVNSMSEEVMPLISNDGSTLYFVRARHEDNVGGAKTGHDIWKSALNEGQYQMANNDLDKINNQGNNAVVGLSEDDKKIYLLNAYKTESKEKKGVALTTSKYDKPSFVQINGMDYSSQFYGFYINPEETVMFISMDGPRSLGKEDIYVSVNTDGSWSQPIQLGGSINTSGYEISPFLSRDGKRLYFSSNGHGGQGSADVFYCEKTGDNWLSWGDPINLGTNVNTTGFDAYFTESIDSTGYFASTRDSENSDIYSVKLNWVEPEVAIEEPSEPEEPIIATTVVEEKPEEPAVPKLEINNIYFDNEHSNLRDESKSTLDKLIQVMNDNPKLTVTLEGHADQNADETYNQWLSERRTTATLNYLVNKGIVKERVIVKSYGEAKPTVNCSDCSEEQLQLNRRVEFLLNWND